MAVPQQYGDILGVALGATWNITCASCELAVAVTASTATGTVTWQVLQLDPTSGHFTELTTGNDIQSGVTVNGVAVTWNVASVEAVSSSCTSTGECSLNVSVSSASPAPLLTLQRTFVLYPSQPGVVRTWASLSADSLFQVTSANIADIQLASVPLWQAPWLFHLGQRGHMPVSRSLDADKPAIRLQFGSYPSSEEDISQTAWTVVYSSVSYSCIVTFV